MERTRPYRLLVGGRFETVSCLKSCAKNRSNFQSQTQRARMRLSASVGSSSVTQREWCGFVRTHRVPIAPHHANVAHTPTRLPRQPVPPSASTWARWNRLEQPELTSQAAARRGAVRARLIRFVRARGLPVLESPACPQ